MDGLLPSYGDATAQDYWLIIAPYVASSDLCAATLVCTRWHAIFAPQLWGNPASHFGAHNDAVYVALTRFRRVLPLARLYVRRMTHTLHFPPAHAELYEGPHADWLRDVLERLPKLQCLIVDRLQFFDHAALIALRTLSRPKQGPQALRLRLLNAVHCANVTFTGLSEALHHFHSLLYLDLSYTAAAKHPLVLLALRSLRSLQILKLKNVHLDDQDVDRLAQSIGQRVRSLDVQGNNATDASVRSLLEHCFHQSPEDTSSRSGHEAAQHVMPWNLPSNPTANSLNRYRGPNLDAHLHKRLTSGFAERLAIEDDPRTGLTHLYIADNHLTVEGIARLVRSRRLHVLDAGTLPPRTSSGQTRRDTSGENNTVHGPPGAEELVADLASHASESLTYLRINHSLVTRDTSCPAEPLGPAELVGDLGVYAPPHAQELDGVALAELPSQTEYSPTAPLHAELPAEPVQIRVTSAEENAAERPPLTRHGSATAPEVVPETIISPVNAEPPIVLNASGSGLTPPGLGASEHPDDQEPASTELIRRKRSFTALVEERRHRTAFYSTTSRCLVPQMLPRLKKLVLTDVPAKAPTGMGVASHLIDFITHCAAMTAQAKEESDLSYTRAPGQTKRAYQHEYVASVIALEQIVLELADPIKPAAKKTSWRGRSSTEDPDSDAFWAAAQNDFTFFDEEECGEPVDRQRSLVATTEKMTVLPKDPRESEMGMPTSGISDLSEPIEDVVAEVSRFRKTRKNAWDAAIRAGSCSPHVEGHWEGKITVIRPEIHS